MPTSQDQGDGRHEVGLRKLASFFSNTSMELPFGGRSCDWNLSCRPIRHGGLPRSGGVLPWTLVCRALVLSMGGTWLDLGFDLPGYSSPSWMQFGCGGKRWLIILCIFGVVIGQWSRSSVPSHPNLKG